MRVSVIIPAYNAEAFLGETIESVLNQTHPVDEVVVVDDGSTDRTAEIAESFGGLVSVLRQNNAGPSVARNRALDHVSGDLIAFLDADDLWAPQKLERQLAYFIAHPEVGSVASSFLKFGAVPFPQVVEMANTKLLRFGPVDYLSSTRIHQSTLVCRSEVVRAMRYPSDISDAEDTIYTALLCTQAPIGAVEEVLMKRREHPGQATKTPNQFRRGVEARISWGKANYKLLSVASAADVVTAIYRGAVEDVMAGYWNRDVAMFKDRRQQLLQIWPQYEPIPKDLHRAMLPLLLLQLKDFLDAWRPEGRKHRVNHGRLTDSD